MSMCFETTLAGWDGFPGYVHGHGVITVRLLRAIAASWGTLTAVRVNSGTATAAGARKGHPRSAHASAGCRWSCGDGCPAIRGETSWDVVRADQLSVLAGPCGPRRCGR